MAAQDTLIFYHSPHSRAAIVRWFLEELGAPYEMRVLNLQAGEHKKPEYFAVNPMGKLPAIQHNGVTVTETGAICCHLADAYPAAGLAPAIGDPRRGEYLRWMFYAPSCIEPAMWDRALKREPGKASMIGYGDFDTVMDVVAKAVSRGPYLLGEQFTAADVTLGSTLKWGMLFGIFPAREEFAAYTDRLNARPAAQRASAADAELAAKLNAS